MRVLINAVAAKVGGASNYIRKLADELAAVDEHEFLFLVPEPQAMSIRGIALHIRVLGSNIGEQPFFRRAWFDQVELPRILRRERIDVLFSTANFATFFCPCRQVLLVRNSLYFSSWYRSKVLPHKSWNTRAGEVLRRWLACRSAMAADVVLTPSQAMLDELRATVPVHTAVINHYGVDRKRFHPAERYFAQDGYASLLFTSLYSEHKNVGTLYRALLHLETWGRRCRLTSTADPGWEKIRNPIRDSDRDLAGKLRQGGLLELTGVLVGSTLDQLYQRADIFVYPSAVESFGHPLLEAMSSGLPVVAADVPVNRELCGEAALYFSPFDDRDCARQIAELIDHADIRRRLVEHGLLRVNDFRWSSHAKRVMQHCGTSPESLAIPMETPV